MEQFEMNLEKYLPALDRFVKFQVRNRQDAEDIVQETCAAAYEKQDTLRDPALFQAWILQIARNKCLDYYRKQARRMELPIEALEERVTDAGLSGRTERMAVRDTLTRLGSTEAQILYLYYFRDLPQDEIARMLAIPLGTVKSRLHYARQRFRSLYAEAREMKGETIMKKLPEIMPEYTIIPSSAAPFPVRWEEIMGWFLVPKLGEKLSWAMYDFPERRRTELCEMEVLGPAEVHGIRGVEIRSMEYDPMDCNSAGGQNPVERHLIAQLTDRYCRLLAHCVTEDGVRRYSTFLDGDSFLNNWGFGPDNCGNEVELHPKGDILWDGTQYRTTRKTFLLDVVGRAEVRICGKAYDCVKVVDCYTYQDGVVSEQYLDKAGRTILWRRFNRDDWNQERWGKPWHELLPENERITVDGMSYVNWYDCITDYIL